MGNFFWVLRFSHQFPSGINKALYLLYLLYLYIIPSINNDWLTSHSRCIIPKYNTLPGKALNPPRSWTGWSSYLGWMNVNGDAFIQLSLIMPVNSLDTPLVFILIIFYVVEEYWKHQNYEIIHMAHIWNYVVNNKQCFIF